MNSENIMPRLIYHEIMKRDNFLWRNASHPDWTLFIMEDGIFTLNMNGEKKTISRGDLVFFPPDMAFSRKVILPITFHFIQFIPASGCSPLPLPSGKITPADKDRLLKSTSALRKINASPYPQKDALVQHILNDIIFECFYESHFQDEPAAESPDAELLEAIEFFKNNLRHKITLDDVSKKIGITPAGLINKFKRKTGVTPIEYLNHIRMAKAKNLLLNSKLSISEISEICGFQNCYYFSNAFKKRFGHSPSDYRTSFCI